MGAERGKAGPASNYGRGGGPASEHEWQSPTPIKADGSRLPMFSRLIHADWSVDPRKRWQASAVRSDGSWKVSARDHSASGPWPGVIALVTHGTAPPDDFTPENTMGEGYPFSKTQGCSTLIERLCMRG